jgi:hypothetical protein
MQPKVYREFDQPKNFTEPLSGTFLFNAAKKREFAGDISSVLLVRIRPAAPQPDPQPLYEVFDFFCTTTKDDTTGSLEDEGLLSCHDVSTPLAHIFGS